MSTPKKRGSSKKRLTSPPATNTLDALTLQPVVNTAADRIVLEIRKLIAASIFHNAQNAEKMGLGLTDMQMIHVLQLYGPSTPSRLAANTGLSSGGVTVALDRLEKAGYIRREPNPADRRSLLIHLVPTHMGKLAKLYEGVEADTRRQLATLSQCDHEAVIRFFEALSPIRAARAGAAAEQIR